MGCCISKCKPRKQHYIEVQDKLVISQQEAPKTPNILLSKKISPSPSSSPLPSSTTSSISSFTCTSSNTSLSSTASSVLSSKDRSFSNEFLWSCVKENPHIVRINSIKEASLALPTTTTKVQAHNKLNSQVKSSSVITVKQSIPQKLNGSSTPQKRVRSSSPAAPLSRQKSFRRDPEILNSPYILSSRGLRSPSPSRRFIGDSKESCPRNMIGSNKVHYSANSVSSYSLRKENIRPGSPSHNNNNSAGLRLCLRNRETFIGHQIGNKINGGGDAIAEALAHSDSDPIPMEDIDNPLISLDCFIFL